MSKFHSVHVLISLSLLSFLASCSSLPQQNESRGKNYYVPDGDGIVMLSPRKKGAVANDQPVTVEPERLETLVAGLYYLEPRSGLGGWISDSKRRIPLVQEGNLAGLSSALSRALADAAPDEDVVVGLQQPWRDSVGTVNGYRITAFRVFVADERLHFLFGAVGKSLESGFHFSTIHRKARTLAPQGGISQQEVEEQVGPRNLAADTGNRVLYSGPQENVLRLRDDWVALDLTVRSSANEQTDGTKTSPAPEFAPDSEVHDWRQKREEQLLQKEVITL